MADRSMVIGSAHRRPLDGLAGATGRVVGAATMAALLMGACSQPTGDTATPAAPTSSTPGPAATSGPAESTSPAVDVPTSSSPSTNAPMSPAGSVPVSPSAIPSAEASGEGLVARLCRARVSAARGGSAAEAFAGAHDGLHEAARDLQDAGERVVAGDLLEAKQRVEAVVGDQPPPDDLPDRLSALIDATTHALTTLGDTPGSCD